MNFFKTKNNWHHGSEKPTVNKVVLLLSNHYDQPGRFDGREGYWNGKDWMYKEEKWGSWKVKSYEPNYWMELPYDPEKVESKRKADEEERQRKYEEKRKKEAEEYLKQKQ